MPSTPQSPLCHSAPKAASRGRPPRFPAKRVSKAPKNRHSLFGKPAGLLREKQPASQGEVVCPIFPEKIAIGGKQNPNTQNQCGRSLITATDKGLSKQKTGQPSKNSELSGRVEVTGFEPVSKHDIQTLSTCLFPDCLSEDDRSGTNQSSP